MAQTSFSQACALVGPGVATPLAQVHTILSIATIHRRADLHFICALGHKGFAIVSITTQHLINGMKFASWKCFHSTCAQTRFEIIRISTVNYQYQSIS